MENVSEDTKMNPAASANFVSKILFWWLNPLFKLGRKRKLEEDDMYEVLAEDRSERLGQDLQRYWNLELEKTTTNKPASLSKCIIQCYWKPYAVLGFFTLVEALRLSSSAMGKTTTGQIVNLLSNDVNKFDDVTVFLHFLWVGPLQAVVVVGLLWQEIGPSCFVGMVVLMVLMLTQTIQRTLSASPHRSKTAVLTDDRIRIMNEVLSGMRIIKMYAWEKPFAVMVSKVRRKEISMIMKSSYLRALNMASFFSTSKVIIFITFTLYVLLGNTITASRVFVTVSLYAAVRLTCTLFFPNAIEKLFETRVSILRIQEFLMLDEIVKSNGELPLGGVKDAAVVIQDLVCSWEKSVATPSLKILSLTLRSNQLLAVIGPVGAGKSSLLSTILGELPVKEGVLEVKGQLTYASQQPWVFPGTIRSNILFGKALDPQKYERVLRACALKRDLELLPDADLTLIGDRGATLSGGQKARVNLARAVYQDADIYLLDDPLSAVDAEVGRHLFEKCICGFLKNKLRILVTHQLQYLQSADQIVVLRKGEIVAKGKYAELQRSGVDFTALLKEEDQQPPQDSLARNRTLSENSVRSHTSSGSSKDDQLPAETVQMVEEESRAQGNIGVGLYVTYLKAGASVVVLLTVILMNILSQVVYILQDWWLAHWANEQDKLTTNSTGLQNALNATVELDTNFYLSVYGGLTGSIVVFGFIRNLSLFHVLVKSVQTLHDRMFNSILRTHVRFFDINPIGRVLNRFSKDIGQLDTSMPWTFVDSFQVFLQVIGVICVVVSVIPWIIILVLPLLGIFLSLRYYFLQTSRNIKRLESTSERPTKLRVGVFSFSFWKVTDINIDSLCHRPCSSESGAYFLYLTTSRWFAIRLDGICALFIFITTFGCLLFKDQLDAGSVGLALTYTVTLIGMFQWGMRQSAEVENMMTSVERVVEYSELESEAPWETQKRPPPNWPNKGLVTFDQVSFSYSSDGPLVLQNMTAMFRPKEKVGIVGRTGAGKSSLVSALFRLSEPQGKIYIDGVLTSEIGLHDLRQKMSIIPQDPVLFTGSMRKNLDPFNQHSDEDLWKALEEVQLKSLLEEQPGGLETVLAESGSNFSTGQRQLVCLARAILRKNRILVIDEATANVDPRTDALIQKTIRDKFNKCTVLTIAHRLNTIVDSDRILVLDAGIIHAYDEPYTLLQDPNGIFYKMVQQTGKQEAAALLQAAKQAYDSRSRRSIPNGHAETADCNLVIFETAL
uniref:ATP-binding cassette, sub-family C (CFTR/MRP), member 4 n=1 Tax=Cyclopterus lumpus TaxID=8103 RepID=A0A8C3A5D1_CYCLU